MEADSINKTKALETYLKSQQKEYFIWLESDSGFIRKNLSNDYNSYKIKIIYRTDSNVEKYEEVKNTKIIEFLMLLKNCGFEYADEEGYQNTGKNYKFKNIKKTVLNVLIEPKNMKDLDTYFSVATMEMDQKSDENELKNFLLSKQNDYNINLQKEKNK